MNARYKAIVDAVNRSIARFNKHLNPAHTIPELNVEAMIKEKSCIEVKHGDWDGFKFPSSDRRGVYFFFGYEKDVPSKTGLYIGKASFDSAIGARMDSWLRPYRSESHFLMRYGNESYILEYMLSIDLDKQELSFMGPALEEFLITDLRDSLNLMNATGNSRRKARTGFARSPTIEGI